MPSLAYTNFLVPLLTDAEELRAAHADLEAGEWEYHRLICRNRAIVITCVSAWEAYIEELVRESLTALRPPVPPLGLWPALNASARSQLGRFNNPNTENVRMLLSDAIGVPDIQLSWSWQGCSSERAVQRLAVAMTYRHQIAHGVNPRPAVPYPYSRELPNFFRRLGRCTDSAVRAHLVNVHGVVNPWPD